MPRLIPTMPIEHSRYLWEHRIETRAELTYANAQEWQRFEGRHPFQYGDVIRLDSRAMEAFMHSNPGNTWIAPCRREKLKTFHVVKAKPLPE